jgi:hypothetical protein
MAPSKNRKKHSAGIGEAASRLMTIEHPSRQKKWAGGRSCQLRPIQQNPERIRDEIYKLRDVQRAEAASEIVDVASVVEPAVALPNRLERFRASDL